MATPDLNNAENELFGMMVMEWIQTHPMQSIYNLRPQDFGINEDQLWRGVEYALYMMRLKDDRLVQ